MVTKIVIRISPEGRAAAAEDSNRAVDIKHLQKRQDDNADDNYDALQVNEEEDIQLCRLQGCRLNEAAGEGICDGQSYHDVSTQGKLNLNDDTSDDSIHDEIDDGAVDICRHKDNSSKKRHLLLDDKGGTEETKRRKRAQPFIDLTDVPPQLPVPKSHGRVGSSRYQGVCFNKSINKWQAKIMLDGKTHSIGNYDDEEEAAVDYARARHTYGVEIIQKGRSSSHTKAQQDMRSSAECKNQTHHGEVCMFESVDEKLSFPMELANKGGRIGIYLPDERKARIAKFHAKRSTRVFRRRVTSDSRKKYADSRPRIKGRFVTQKSVNGGEDSA